MTLPTRIPILLSPCVMRHLLSCVLALTIGCSPPSSLEIPTDTYSDLTPFFSDWRAFRAPPSRDGVPDFSPDAMNTQFAELSAWQDALKRFPVPDWPVEHQIDWHLIRAEMNGLEFDHRVLRPWQRDPAFYVFFHRDPTDVPMREGPMIEGAIEASYYNYPLSDADAAHILAGLVAIPELLQRARINLTGNARDLWVKGIGSILEQRNSLIEFANRPDVGSDDIVRAAHTAADASELFAQWLGNESPSKTGSSGVGKENLTWALKNIHYINLSWEQEELLLKRELARAHTALRLEENRNRRLPALERIASAPEYEARLNAAVDEYMEFLEEEEILPMKDYMDLALRERIGSFTPAEGLRGFFSEIGYRDELAMRTHHYHWFDLARMRDEPHESEIRATPLWYNIFDGRAEGMATGMEEMMMHAGLFDDRPQARELVWILLAQRAARALGGLYQHGGLMTHEEATRFADKWTPRGYLPWDGETIQWEQHFYLRQPTYGTSYVIGKIEIEKLLAEYARQRGSEFSLHDFMNDFNSVGLIPVSLIAWQLNGDDSEVRALMMGD